MPLTTFLARLWQPYTKHIAFPCAHSLDASVERLQQALVPQALPGFGRRDGCTGDVTDKQVTLNYQYAYRRNTFAPRFTGQFTCTVDGVQLIGGFAQRGIIKALLIYLLLFWLLFIGIVLYGLATHGAAAGAWIVLGGGILTMLLMAAILHLGQSWGRKTEALISDTIRRQLQA